jgi:hypothetical protein
MIVRYMLDSHAMENFHLQWVRHKLTRDLRRRRLEIYGRLLPILEATELDSFRMLVTGNESWLVLECQHSAKWGMVRAEVSTRVNQTIGTKKVMLTVIWGMDGFHIVDIMRPRGFLTPSSSYSHYESFAGESLSARKEKPCTLTECPPGQFSGLLFEWVKTL